MSKGFFQLKPRKVPLIKTKHREIKTKLPAPGTNRIAEDLGKTESNSMHGQMPICWSRAKDFSVWDISGNKFIDFTSGIFVTNAGHGNPRVIEAINRVAKKPLLHTYTYYSEERRDYLKYLIQKTPRQFEKAFLLSAGTEATEVALKLMRLIGAKRKKRRPGIITFEGNWHGRTLGAQMMSWNPKQKEWIGYHDPNMFSLPFPYPWLDDAMKDPEQFFLKSLARLAKDKKIDPKKDIAGFMLETFQGWGAVFYPPQFVQAIEKFAKKNNILLSFDEMQSGFGRTGKLFGYMHYNVEPDILACGKGAGSGVPLSLVLGSSEIMDITDVGSMSSTHSANPLVCAVGRANLKAIIDDKLIQKSEKLGKELHERLGMIQERFNNILSDVFGTGMIASLIFTTGKDRKPLSKFASAVCERALEKGLILVHTGRESIKLGPPLTISREALHEGLDVIEETIAEISAENPNLLVHGK